MTRFLPFILRNALRSKRRTILTVLSIVVSLFLFCTLRTVLTSFDASLEIGRRGAPGRAPFDLAHLLPAARRTRTGSPRSPASRTVTYSASGSAGSTSTSGNFFAQFAVDPDELPRHLPRVPSSRPRRRRRSSASAPPASSARSWPRKYGFKIGDQHHPQGDDLPGQLGLHRPRHRPRRRTPTSTPTSCSSPGST